jgi:hypothetical protein
MAKHFTAVIKVHGVELVAETEAYPRNNPKPPEKKVEREVFSIVLRADSLEKLNKKIQASTALITED